MEEIRFGMRPIQTSTRLVRCFAVSLDEMRIV